MSDIPISNSFISDLPYIFYNYICIYIYTFCRPFT